MKVLAETSKPYLYSILSAACMAVAWWYPGSVQAVYLGWLWAITLVIFFTSKSHLYRAAFIGGALQTFLDFYWIKSTVADFGGFSWLSSSAIFALFIIGSSLQYVLAVFIFKQLPRWVHSRAIAVAIAWVSAEMLAVRIFPWHSGHTQIAFTSFAQAAALAGAPFLSFMLVWICDSSLALVDRSRRNALLFLPWVVFTLLLYYGIKSTHFFDTSEGPTLDVALVQANISITEKHNERLVLANTERYLQLTHEITTPNTLVVWPEAVIQNFIPAGVGHILNDPTLALFEEFELPLLVGGLTFESQSRFFNSAIAIQPNGNVLLPYHKQILMPFGEYTPFGDALPFLRVIHPINDFSAGEEVKVFTYRDLAGKKLARVAPLICYEDIVPQLSRHSVLKGAQLLVNITNDAWFGDSMAPYQHHLIAAFRAIENRRFLLRSTNTGLTAIVDPLGR
ncbi:MAG: apolipoprotein N-acyltransferase, partial [Bdellovibrionales bacterium]|nr:apolipoprotein N-acyltransferase [Bdellovibrionales bacterium]